MSFMITKHYLTKKARRKKIADYMEQEVWNSTIQQTFNEGLPDASTEGAGHGREKHAKGPYSQEAYIRMQKDRK